MVKRYFVLRHEPVASGGVRTYTPIKVSGVEFFENAEFVEFYRYFVTELRQRAFYRGCVGTIKTKASTRGVVIYVTEELFMLFQEDFVEAIEINLNFFRFGDEEDEEEEI